MTYDIDFQLYEDSNKFERFQFEAFSPIEILSNAIRLYH